MGAEYNALRATCAADPLLFPRLAWGRTYWSRQSEAKRLMRSHDRVWLKGGHSTGKTHVVTDDNVEFVTLNPGAQLIILGATHDAAKNTIWADLRAAVIACRVHGLPPVGADSWMFGPKWGARLASPDKPETIHGVHGRNVRVVVDEATAMEAEIWPAIDSLMASEGAQLIILFNPIKAEHKTRQMVQDPRFKGVTFSCLEHPNVVSGSNVYPGAVTRDWVDAFRARVERRLATEDEWRSRVLGEFPVGGDDQIVTEADLEAAADGCLPDVSDERRIGVDLARKGGDKNVLVVVDERRRVCFVDAWVGQDTMETVGKILAAIRTHRVRPEYTSVDACGIGGPMFDRLREQGCHVADCDFGGKVLGDWSDVVDPATPLLNRKTELHLVVRNLIRSKQLSIPREFREIWADLCAQKFKYTSSEKQKVESKESVREAIGRSPDYSDALVIAFHTASFVGGYSF